MINPQGSGMPPHPMDVGGVYDAALKFYRDHFVTLIGACTLITVPAALLTALAGPNAASFIAAIVVVLLPTVTVLVADQVITTGSATIGSTWRRLRGRFGVLAVTTLMLAGLLVAWAIAVVVGFALLFVPGLLATVGGSIYVVRWIFVLVVTAAEDERYGDALSRSSELVAGHWWRVLGILLLTSLVINTAEFALGGAVGALAAWAKVSADSFDRLVAIASAPILVLLLPLQASILTMLYYDQRVRREGTDIAAALDAIPPPQAGPQR